MMNYLFENNWNVNEKIQVKYYSESFSAYSLSIVSVQKTYIDGTDIIRSIHQENGSFVIISSAESRCSGPSEIIEAKVNSLEEAQNKIIEACKEDDAFYEE